MALAEAKNDYTLELKRTFNAPRDQVFAAWTQAEAVSRWFAPSEDCETTVSELQLQVGGRYQFNIHLPNGEIHSVAGEYVAITPPEQLVFTWVWINKEDQSEMLVTVDFVADGDRTNLILTHEQLPDETSRELHGEGWTGCLNQLEKLFPASD